MSSIPASAIVQVNPSVVSSGGSALELIGICLTQNTRVPIGTVPSFASLAAVTAYFGAGSTEVTLAGFYFGGYTISTTQPAALLFYQYNGNTAVAGYLRGGSLAGVSLATLQSYSGTLTVSVDGSAHTTASINLSAATSFSNAATIIQSALTTASAGATVTFDAVSQSFVITSNTTGATSAVNGTSGTFAGNLLLTTATGATASPGAATTTPAAAMTTITNVTQNWASFFMTFEPVLADKISFAAWTNSQNNRYLYVPFDTDVTPTTSNAATNSFGYEIGPNGSNYSGTSVVWKDPNAAAFLAGIAASLNFNQTNGRATAAFRVGTGLTPAVTSLTVATNLLANGYNYYGAYATANTPFNFFYNGTVSGPFEWFDSYVNQIQLNAAFQLALLELLVAVGSIPYNPPGYALIEAALLDPINAGLNFGTIRTGVTLSSAQAAEVNNLAGLAIATTLSQRGYYLQILDPGAQVRGNRGTPVINFWYMDGESVQMISMSSILVQ